jgi:hypothetical protein
MAKNEKSNDAPQEFGASDEKANPVSVTPVEAPVMHVDKQHALHHAAANPMQALLPGHDLVPAHDGLMGSIERRAIQANKEGDNALAADLETLLVNLGEASVGMDIIKERYIGKLDPSFLTSLKL